MVQTRSQSRKKEVLKSISLFTNPFSVLYYFSLYCIDSLSDFISFMLHHLLALSLFTILIAAGTLYLASLNHLTEFYNVIAHYSYWVLLGVASSIGLGTGKCWEITVGLHTFVLFLGPFIAKTTLTAYSCGNLDFATRGPDAFICDSSSTSPLGATAIFAKVVLECFFWGAGTALGELPPYFVARAAAAAGQNDDDFSNIELLLKKKESDRSISERLQVFVFSLMQSSGFWGILICASV